MYVFQSARPKSIQSHFVWSRRNAWTKVSISLGGHFFYSTQNGLEYTLGGHFGIRFLCSLFSHLSGIYIGIDVELTFHFRFEIKNWYFVDRKRRFRKCSETLTSIDEIATSTLCDVLLCYFRRSPSIKFWNNLKLHDRRWSTKYQFLISKRKWNVSSTSIPI